MAVLALGSAWSVEPPPAGCGRPGLIGLASHAHLGDDGALTLVLTLTDGPAGPLVVRPLVFADGVLRPAASPVELACLSEVTWSSGPTGVRHALHWTVVAATV